METKNEQLISKEAKSILNELLDELKIKPTSIEITRATKNGDNFLGLIARAKIIGTDNLKKTKDLNLILKCAINKEEFRKYTHMSTLFKREALWYETVLPELLNLQKEITNHQIFKPWPHFYKKSTKEPNEVLILEDMCSMGFTMENKKEALDFNHAMFAMEQYGKFHALSFALKDKRPAIYNKLLKQTKEQYFTTVDREMLSQTVEKICQRILDGLNPAEDEETMEKLKNFKDYPKQNLADDLLGKNAGEGVVFCHGDCWINNILYKHEQGETTKPSAICILDWQLSRCASPATDLSYLIFTCTDKKLRDEHYEHLLKAYHSSLCDFLRILGSKPDIFSYETLLDHMKKFSKYGLTMSIIVLQLIMSETDEIPDWTKEIPEESDRIDFLTSKTRKNDNKILNRLVEVVRDFNKLQYF